MKLSQFTELLHAHPDKPFHLVLPGAKVVPHSFHITEVGHVAKNFIDCGGKLHSVQSCQLQVWLGEDTDHRLYAGKMAHALELAQAKGVLPAGEDLDVEIEYEDMAISQYLVTDFSVTESAVVLSLDSKHTDCLAKELCCPPTVLTMAPQGSAAEQSCCTPGSGCC